MRRLRPRGCTNPLEIMETVKRISRGWILSYIVAGILISASISGCSTTIPLPEPGPLPERSEVRDEALIPKEVDDIRPPSPLPKGFRFVRPAVGEKTLHEVTVTRSLADAQAAAVRGEVDKALALLEQAEGENSQAVYRWYLSAYKAHILNLAGRAPEGEEIAQQAAKMEIEMRGSDLVSRTLRGDARFRLGEFRAARSDYLSVLDGLGDWRFPTSYTGFPTNMRDLAITVEARIRALLGLAITHALEGDYKSARPWSLATERQYADLIYVKNHPIYGSALGALHSDVYLARAVNLVLLGAGEIVLKGRNQKAEAFFNAAQSYFGAIGFRQGDVYIWGFKAKAYLDSGDTVKALNAADTAAAMGHSLGLPDFVWRVQFLAGEALLQEERWEEAESRFKDAQAAVDEITGLLGNDRSKRRFGVGKEDITHRLAQLAFRRGDAGALFEYLERGRARAFVDMLAGVHVAGSRGVEDIEKIRSMDARARKTAVALEVGQTADGRRGVRVVDDTPPEMTLKELVREREQAVERLRRRLPELVDTVAVDTSSLASVQKGISPGETILYWLPYRENEPLRLLAISRSETDLRSLKAKGDDIASLLDHFEEAVRKFDGEAQVDISNRMNDTLEVAEWKASEGFYVVPTGKLYHIPWGVLETDVPISVLPTGSWLLRTHQRQANSQKALIVGDPNFHGRLPQLPAARAEAKAVAAYYETKAVIGNQATEATLRKRTGAGVDVLHLATHGYFDPNRPLNSAVFLADTPEKGALTARELFEDPLPARLVVLSGCETGVGEIEAGDDILGLPRSFYLGGTVSIVSSLWKVDDEGTAMFMRIFHRTAKELGDYGTAWLAARNAVKKAGMAPWIYGAFVLGGARR